MVQDFYCVQMSVSGCNSHYESVLGAGAKVEDPPTGGDEIPPWRGKNRDKQLTFIVRVRLSFLFSIYFQISFYYLIIKSIITRGRSVL
jgi:hypothetical protein